MTDERPSLEEDLADAFYATLREECERTYLYNQEDPGAEPDQVAISWPGEYGVLHLHFDNLQDGYDAIPFQVRISVERMPDLPWAPGGKFCADCDSNLHMCGGCGYALEHGESDCAGRGGKACPTYVGQAEHEDAFCTVWPGDSLFSPSRGTWHPVREISTHEGMTSAVIDKGDASDFRFQQSSDAVVRVRYGPDHLRVLDSGLPVESILYGTDGKRSCL
jgi:hypothetical protein